MHPHPLLKNEDVQLLFEGLRRLLAERGYQRRDMTWYSYSSELVRVLQFSPGVTRSRMWFKLGFSFRALDSLEDKTVWAYIRPLRCRATHPQIDDCAISIPLQKLVEDRDAFENLCDFTDAAVAHSSAVPQIMEVITKVALPFLERFSTLEDIRKLVCSDLAARCKITEAARKVLQEGGATGK